VTNQRSELEDFKARAQAYEQAFLVRGEDLEQLFYCGSWQSRDLGFLDWWKALIAQATAGLLPSASAKVRRFLADADFARHCQ